MAPRLLTEVELELMQILWRLGPSTVHDVLAALPQNRDLAYTSVSTILRILEKKKVVLSRKNGRSHLYVPKLTKEKYEATAIQHMLGSVFEDQPRLLVKQLLDSVGVDDEELREIKKLLAEHEAKA